RRTSARCTLWTRTLGLVTMPVPCFRTVEAPGAALACDGTISAMTASVASAAIVRTFLFSNPDGSVVILISLQKRQDAPGRSAGRTVSPYRGLSQAVAEGMRSQPAQASPASAGNDGAVGGTREEDQPPGSRQPH